MTAVRSRRNAFQRKICRPGLPEQRKPSVFLARQLGDASDVRPAHENDNVSGYTLRHGRYEVLGSFIRSDIFAETETRLACKTVTVVDGWIDDDIFYRSHIRTIERLRDLWRCVKRPTHPYYDSHDPEDRQDGPDSERAKNILRNCRRLVGHYRWNIFENVIRWNEPSGVPGSRLLHRPRVEFAQQVVRGVAEQIRSADIL